MDKSFTLESLVDVKKNSFTMCLVQIAFNPIFWNVVARYEYKTQFISKVVGARIGCYLLAIAIFSLGIWRDLLYHWALEDQPSHPLLDNEVAKIIGIGCFSAGNILVLSSMWALGVTGTYLGDYFGILMDHRVSGFPFSLTDNPMYWGSTLCFLGTGLYYGKPAGILITLAVFRMYQVALKYEEPFTASIYAKREEERKKQK